MREKKDTNQHLLAIIPARNEAATVGEIVRRVRAVVGSDILVVNDASDDESRDAAKQSWKDFQADPDWTKVKDASEANGKIVTKVESIYAAPTSMA